MSEEKIATPKAAPKAATPVPVENPFNLAPVKEKPKRAYRKGSKYDPLLEAFMKGTDKLVEASVPDKDSNYIRTQLSKRVDAVPAFKNIKISVVNNKCYLEK